jgi:hypoxia up-regulated 1
VKPGADLLSIQVTREELETLSADLFERATAPIERALASAKVTLDQIQHVIIVGAGTRVPKIQEILTKFVGRDLGKNLNADEAAAMGAVYRAADLSTGFQVKKFLTKDSVIFPIVVDFERELDPDEDGKKVVKFARRTLFSPMNPYPQKKVLTFNKHNEDFTFFVNYGNLSGLAEQEVGALGPLNLTQVDLKGISDALKKHSDVQDASIEFKGIKAHFNVDDSGLLALGTVEATFEKIIAPTSDAPPTEEQASAEGNATESPNATASNSSATSDKKTEKEKKPKVETMREDIEKAETILHVADLGGDQFQEANKR